MLPNFLGIGCYRAGSTWLHDLLQAHPDAYVPERRKEIHFFFTQNYKHGIEWYERFFPSQRDARTYIAIGEIGPGYLYHGECIARIVQVPSIQRFMVIVRDPVERAYSHYLWHARYFADAPSFSTHIADEPRILEEGLYAKYLKPWIRTFGKDRFLLLQLEQVRRDPHQSRRRVAEFLGLDPDRFSQNAGTMASNRGQALARPALSYAAARTHNWLIRHDLDPFVRPFRKLGKLMLNAGKKTPLPVMDEETRQSLRIYYRRPNTQLSELMSIELQDWQ